MFTALVTTLIAIEKRFLWKFSVAFGAAFQPYFYHLTAIGTYLRTFHYKGAKAEVCHFLIFNFVRWAHI